MITAIVNTNSRKERSRMVLGILDGAVGREESWEGELRLMFKKIEGLHQAKEVQRN